MRAAIDAGNATAGSSATAVIQGLLGERLQSFTLQPFGRRESKISGRKPVRLLVKNGYLSFKRTCSSVLPGKVNLTMALLSVEVLNLPLAIKVFVPLAVRLAVVFSVPVNSVSSPMLPLLSMVLPE